MPVGALRAAAEAAAAAAAAGEEEPKELSLEPAAAAAAAAALPRGRAPSSPAPGQAAHTAAQLPVVRKDSSAALTGGGRACRTRRPQSLPPATGAAPAAGAALRHTASTRGSLCPTESSQRGRRCRPAPAEAEEELQAEKGLQAEAEAEELAEAEAEAEATEAEEEEGGERGQRGCSRLLTAPSCRPSSCSPAALPSTAQSWLRLRSAQSSCSTGRPEAALLLRCSSAEEGAGSWRLRCCCLLTLLPLLAVPLAGGGCWRLTEKSSPPVSSLSTAAPLRD